MQTASTPPQRTSSNLMPGGRATAALSAPPCEQGEGAALAAPAAAAVPANPPPLPMLPPAGAPKAMMRAALGPMAFKSIRSLMLRQQSAYGQQLSELHTLNQVQGLLTCEIWAPAEGDGAAFTQLQRRPFQKGPCQPKQCNGLFSQDIAVYGGDHGCGGGSPLPSHVCHSPEIYPVRQLSSAGSAPQAPQSASLRYLARILGALPKALRGGRGSGKVEADAAACLPLPPLPCGLLRPEALGLLPPGDDTLGGSGPASSMRLAVKQLAEQTQQQQEDQKHKAWQVGDNGRGSDIEEGVATGAEEEGEEGGEGRVAQKRRRGYDGAVIGVDNAFGYSDGLPCGLPPAVATPKASGSLPVPLSKPLAHHYSS